MKTIEQPTLSFFGDASSKDCKFMVLCGLAVGGHRINEIESQIADIREKGKIRREFHWQEYRGGEKRRAYEELIEYGFSLIHKKHAALHLLSCNFMQFDHKRGGPKSKDGSINRLYWQLCLHRAAQYYGRERAIHVRLDAGNDSAEVCSLRNQLCAKSYSTYNARPNCFRSIEPISSENSGIIQLCDVIVGGVASQINGNRVDTPKGQLAEFIRKQSGRHSWSVDSHKDERFLTVWHIKPNLGPP
jgi:hypothetical protein